MLDPYNAEWETWLQKWFTWLLVPAILVNAGGLLIPILEPDGSLYATIAKTIARSGDFINLRVEGKDWLDKPHFPFWIAAISFRCFGINAFAYKFPALLFWAAGAWYTWRLALSLYGKPVAQLATLIYVSAAHLVISNNDVRAEPYLTGLIIGSVYHFYKASRTRPGWHLIFGSLLAACAVMTKGPFVLITIAAGFILDWIVGKEWAQFRNIRWVMAIVLTAIFTLPELICLYLQFDLHPEKQVFGHNGVSGLRFFFWDSQFGRFFNTGPIKGAGDPFFYFHTLLWAFLPWSLILYAAIVQKCRRSAGGTGHLRRNVIGDYICLGAALASFIVFSLSRFQLPHYLNILFPFFSILAAGYLYGLRRRWPQRTLSIIQGVINILLPVLLLLLCWLYHFDHWVLIMTGIILFSILPFLLFRGQLLTAAVTRSFWMALLVFSFVNFILYPAILQYQAGTQAGRFIAGSKGPVYMFQEAPSVYSFEFDCPLPVERISMRDLPVSGGPVLVFAPTAFADSLARRGYHTEEIRQFPNFHVSQLTGEFLNYRTRKDVLQSYSILSVGK
ncbi:MAG TPA: glycosyltransferase family 39 protein [Puia sp.]|jgi:4-amino-4-deoxy-L-arabinose transferase-like glycosyltransferase|nr:glycosyltransferase family 39 protein [Puia sp.]